MTADKLPSVQAIVDELSGRDDKGWPKKGLLPSAYLSAKYFVLYKIGISNWTPYAHGSAVTPSALSIFENLFLISWSSMQSLML